MHSALVLKCGSTKLRLSEIDRNAAFMKVVIFTSSLYHHLS